jgi:hypothetical protein
MAQLVLTNADITVNGVVLSDRANQVTLNYEVEAVEVTAFGNTGRAFTGGLQNNTIDIEFHQDFAATETEATIFPIVGTTTIVTVRPSSAATSATNPLYTVTGTYLAAHTPVSGTVGELATTSLSFQGGTLVKTTA